MLIHYDLHLHSGLSPCADKEMTPANIVGFAALNGIDMIAVSDHNSIKNVEVAIRIGEVFGVTVVPAFELQTAEDIHLLCLFPTFDKLQDFYNNLEFQIIKNNPEIFGNQYIYDEDDNIIGEEKNLLLTCSNIPSYKVPELIKAFDGVAVPAHIDREANSMLEILGSITPEFKAVELSVRASPAMIKEYSEKYKVIIDSDSHILETISSKSVIEIEENSPTALIKYLRS